MANDWRPVETAPKDGTPLWLVEDGAPMGYTLPHYFVGYWTRSHRLVAGGFWQGAYRDLVGHPTHWQPLPEPPQ